VHRPQHVLAVFGHAVPGQRIAGEVVKRGQEPHRCQVFYDQIVQPEVVDVPGEVLEEREELDDAQRAVATGGRLSPDEVLPDTAVITMLPALSPTQAVSRSGGKRSREPGLPHPVAQVQRVAAILQQDGCLSDPRDPAFLVDAGQRGERLAVLHSPPIVPAELKREPTPGPGGTQRRAGAWGRGGLKVPRCELSALTAGPGAAAWSG
jgi:hypothetical protein